MFPALISAQNNTSVSNINAKQTLLSFQYGAQLYTGNRLLEDKKFSREGVFASVTLFAKKDITKKVHLISKSSLTLSNAIAKKINITMPEINIDFTTKIPNMLSCNINYSLTVNKQINNFLDHGISLKFRLFPLFYKKGQIFNTELHSLGGLISSEENGSLPDLEKATKISYIINYWFNELTSMKFSLFAYSDLAINNLESYRLYPGVAIKFETILNKNFLPPWIKKRQRLNK